MSTRLHLLLAIIAFACLAFVTEGRLSDPTASISDEASTDSSIELSNESFEEGPVSIDGSSKFKSFVNTAKLERIGNTSMCEHIHPDELPEECSCREPGPFSLVIECLKTFNSTFLNDTIGMKIDLDPCNEEGAKLSLDVTEKEHGIDYTLAGIVAGELDKS